MQAALLVIDYINGIANGSCKDFFKSHPILENTNKLIAFARKKGIPIYFIRLAYDKSYTGIPKHSNSLNQIKCNYSFQLGSEDVNFVENLNYQEGKDLVINKTVTSPFRCIQSIIPSQIECLIFTGLATDNAINIGVREAHDAGYYTIIAEDGCGASSEEFHDQALRLLKKIANEILPVNSIIGKMEIH